MTILLVEPDLRKALAVAERGVILETGRLRLAGTSAELADKGLPLSPCLAFGPRWLLRCWRYAVQGIGEP